jgi:hypothetical protein
LEYFLFGDLEYFLFCGDLESLLLSGESFLLGDSLLLLGDLESLLFGEYLLLGDLDLLLLLSGDLESLLLGEYLLLGGDLESLLLSGDLEYLRRRGGELLKKFQFVKFFTSFFSFQKLIFFLLLQR